MKDKVYYRSDGTAVNDVNDDDGGGDSCVGCAWDIADIYYYNSIN